MSSLPMLNIFQDKISTSETKMSKINFDLENCSRLFAKYFAWQVCWTHMSETYAGLELLEYFLGRIFALSKLLRMREIVGETFSSTPK